MGSQRSQKTEAILALANAVKKVKVKVTRFAQGIPMRVVRHGKSHYLVLPRELVNYYHIESDDVLFVKPIELKRLEEVESGSHS